MGEPLLISNPNVASSSHGLQGLSLLFFHHAILILQMEIMMMLCLWMSLTPLLK
jgi:hypothetical protein